MNYNFDEVIDRRGTCSEKVDGMVNVWGKSDLIPMWVADMDFATPPFILEAIRKRCEHPVLGYTFRSDDYYQSIIGWLWYVGREGRNQFCTRHCTGSGYGHQLFHESGRQDYDYASGVPSFCLAGDT